MSKKLIFALAFAMVLVSGAFMNAHAATLSGPYFSQPACWSFACGLAGVHAIAQAPAPVVPVHMGAVGY
ncbi:MAG: hypothetical protein M1398_04395 [Deltaproteobacteria bacterium]|nr:hypothetical protein [Deltaproteobacteria bacterium]MDA8307681.1 hypothetical protein [Deltaproteobacteria bacterium]